MRNDPETLLADATDWARRAPDREVFIVLRACVRSLLARGLPLSRITVPLAEDYAAERSKF